MDSGHGTELKWLGTRGMHRSIIPYEHTTKNRNIDKDHVDHKAKAEVQNSSDGEVTGLRGGGGPGGHALPAGDDASHIRERAFRPPLLPRDLLLQEV